MIVSRQWGRVLPALLAGLVLLLGACSSSDEKVSVLTCPQVYMVQDAAHYVDYAPGGTDLIDVRYDAKMISVEWLCTFITDENRLEMEVRFGMRAMMGPSGKDAVGRFPYFVVVSDPDGEIIAKQVFAIDIGFPGNAIEVGHIESVFQKMTYASLARAADYTVYIGFQLTPEQLERIRAGQDL